MRGAALALTVLLAGCGGSGEDTPGADGADGSPAATSQADGSTSSTGTGSTGTGSTGTETTQAPGEAVVITISGFTYDVPDTIAPGTQVTVRNEDDVMHTVTSDEEGIFDVPVDGGSEATFTVPEEPGDYPFHCTPHPAMTATLVVG